MLTHVGKNSLQAHSFDNLLRGLLKFQKLAEFWLDY